MDVETAADKDVTPDRPERVEMTELVRPDDSEAVVGKPDVLATRLVAVASPVSPAILEGLLRVLETSVAALEAEPRAEEELSGSWSELASVPVAPKAAVEVSMGPTKVEDSWRDEAREAGAVDCASVVIFRVNERNTEVSDPEPAVGASVATEEAVAVSCASVVIFRVNERKTEVSDPDAADVADESAVSEGAPEEAGLEPLPGAVLS